MSRRRCLISDMDGVRPGSSRLRVPSSGAAACCRCIGRPRRGARRPPGRERTRLGITRFHVARMPARIGSCPTVSHAMGGPPMSSTCARPNMAAGTSRAEKPSLLSAPSPCTASARVVLHLRSKPPYRSPSRFQPLRPHSRGRICLSCPSLRSTCWTCSSSGGASVLPGPTTRPCSAIHAGRRSASLPRGPPQFLHLCLLAPCLSMARPLPDDDRSMCAFPGPLRSGALAPTGGGAACLSASSSPVTPVDP